MVGFSAKVRQSSVLDHPVTHRSGHVIITEQRTPFGKCKVGGQDQTAFFIGQQTILSRLD